MIRLIAKIYIDECLSPLLAQLLRREGVDVVSAHDVGMAGKSDRANLLFAKQEGRVLVTVDKSDFAKLLREIHDHSGIIACPQVSLDLYAILAERILDKLTLVDDWSNVFIWVSLK